MTRNNAQILDDLVNLNADEWNILLSEEMNISVNILKKLSLAREFISDDKSKIIIYKDTFKEIFKQTQYEKTLLNDVMDTSNILDKYVVMMSDEEQVINSISCSGKIIVGLDFTKAHLEDSYFSNCVFYNCNFTDTNFGSSVFNSCTMNHCNNQNADFGVSTLSRNKFISCNFKSAGLEYSVFTDNAFLSCDLSQTSFRQSKILYTGFNECNIKGTDFREVDFVQLSSVDSDFKYSDFRKAKMVDSILLRTNLSKCNLDTFSASAITHNQCNIDDKYKDYFKMAHHLNTPSLFEWEQEDGDV